MHHHKYLLHHEYLSGLESSKDEIHLSKARNLAEPSWAIFLPFLLDKNVWY